jgi:hypothetical protein
VNDELFKVEEPPDIKPFRCRENYLTGQDVKIESVVLELTVIKNKKSYGYVFHSGFLEIPQKGFAFIAGKMGIQLSDIVS